MPPSKACTFILVLALASVPGLAQGNQNPISVAISVHDSAGAQIPGAKVEIQASKLTLTTSSEGKAIASLAPGDYDIIASFPGFVPFRKQIKVAASGNQAVDFSLVVGGGSTVQVTPDPHQLVLIVEHSTVGVLKLEDFAKLPHKTVTFHNVHTNAD